MTAPEVGEEDTRCRGQGKVKEIDLFSVPLKVSVALGHFIFTEMQAVHPSFYRLLGEEIKTLKGSYWWDSELASLSVTSSELWFFLQERIRRGPRARQKRR